MNKDDLIWGFMIQLGHNMWGELPLDGDALLQKACSA